MREQLTVLETLGPLLTKTFCADGSVIPYGDAASFKIKTCEIEGWTDLRELLTELHSKPKRCLIRGKFVGKAKATAGSKEGTYARTNANFDDQPLHWFMADVDGFEPGFADPVTQPALAIEEYIESVLPMLQGCSYYWHLSSSAGQKGKGHILKAHIHFINETPYTTAQMHAWSKTIGKQIDSALFRRVQVHYTAHPIFEDGVTDPVPVRAGFHQGEHDFAKLVITEATLSEAREQGAGTGSSDMKLVDPSEKDGLIGLFHRAFTAEEVLLELLDRFEQISERRYTWFDGGGTPEGVWVHEDGLHVGSSHNTWPIDGIANLWDLVRVFKFGHLDDVDTGDDFDKLDAETIPVGQRPSDLAMKEWARSLPEVIELNKEERSTEMTSLLANIAAAPDAFTLETVVAPEIREATLLVIEREAVQTAFRARLTAHGTTLTKSDVAKMLRPVRVQAPAPALNGDDSDVSHLPRWAQPWVWVSEENCFMNLGTKELITERSFNANFDRFIMPDPDGNRPRASDLVLRDLRMRVVSRCLYSPQNDEIFMIDGLRVANTFRFDMAVEMPTKLSTDGRKAIKLVEDHAALLIPCPIERGLFLDYLAYCIQKPGSKIRWAPLLKGVEGDGKSAFVIMMSHILGHQNVRVLDSSTLEKSDFTSWRVGQCFTGVEEMKLHGHNRYDVFNKLKTALSNDFVEVHCKGKDPITVPNTTNYLLLTNFDDGVPLNDNDRRIMFLRSPFLKKEELYAKLAEMGYDKPTDYYDNLFDFAIKRHAGALRKWLTDRHLSEDFKPDGRAPDTDARDLAVDMSRRDDEDAIESALDDTSFGVYPNLVAVACLNNILQSAHGIKIQTSRVKSVLAAYGWQRWGAQMRWRGRNYSWYYKGERPTAPGIRAEELEIARLNRELEDGFAD